MTEECVVVPGTDEQEGVEETLCSALPDCQVTHGSGSCNHVQPVTAVTESCTETATAAQKQTACEAVHGCGFAAAYQDEAGTTVPAACVLLTGRRSLGDDSTAAPVTTRRRLQTSAQTAESDFAKFVKL